MLNITTEIAALTALIGSSTAQALILGNRGAAGLVWGSMSNFGAMSAIKGCVAAATPAWLRETFGLRSKEIDGALGVALALDGKSSHHKCPATSACGIACNVARDYKGLPDQPLAQSEASQTSCQDIYVFDKSITGLLEVIPDEETKDSFYVNSILPDLYRREIAARIVWKDWMGIIASTLKLAEVALLWKDGASALCLISGCSWAYFFSISVAFQATGLSRNISGKGDDRDLDLLAGQIPTPVKAGGQCKILLGAPQNVRHSSLWRMAWAFGSLVLTTSVVAAYLTLSSQNQRIFVEWTGFQILWLALRSAFYHFSEDTDSVLQNPILQKRTWNGLSRPLKARIRGLVQALSLYQMHVHPRGFYCYDEDERIIRETYNPKARFTLPARTGDGEPTSVYISAVLGDTMLSSSCFITGRKFAPFDQYDTCVVIFTTSEGEIAIPSARVATGSPPPRDHNIETGYELLLPPRGGTSRAKDDTSWWYWIPCEGDQWLEIHTTEMHILGKREAKIMTGDAITKHLTSGELYVSISEVAQVDEIVSNSRLGFEAVQRLLQ